jgi:hypothetical protein
MPETTSLAGTLALLKARAAEQVTMLPLYWREDWPVILPDEPAPFVYFELEARRGRLVAFGAGRGNNLYRNPSELRAYVFTPRDVGLETAPNYAEAVAAAFRSFRSGGVSCFDATLFPAASASDFPDQASSAAGNYTCVMVIVSLTYDQIG